VVARTTKALEELDVVLADPAIYVKDPRKAADLGQKRLKAQAAVDKAEAEWMEIAGGLYRGLGQRVLATEGGSHALLDVREIAITATDGATDSST
jgi:protein involved in temperature-dependent protein secretion